MKKILIVILGILFSLSAETLFEIKDASDSPVFSISDDGMRVINAGDTMMVITAAEAKINLDNSKDKALSRSFSVTTSTTGKAGLANMLEVTTEATTMREGVLGEHYTDFSPENMFLGLNAGRITAPDGTWGEDNLFIGNEAGFNHTTGNDNIFIGKASGYITNYGSRNVFLGLNAGYNNKTGADNIYIGKEAGKGYQSGTIYSNGGSNVAIGVNSGFTIKQASSNVFTGYWSGYNTTDGDKNVFIGSLCGYKNTIENYNVYLGFAAAAFNNGERNVIIGAGDDDHMPPGDTVMSDCVFLGFGAGTYETNSNRLHIENSANATPLIYGEFDNDYLTFNTVRTHIVHPTGTGNGLYFQNTYLGNTDTWHFYQYTTDVLALFFNSTKVGEFNNVSGAYTATSDLRSKKNIIEMTRVLDKVMLLQPKMYNFASQKDNEEKYMGLIAQDAEKIFPSLVNYNTEDDTYTLDYAGFSIVAIKAIKEQQIAIEENKKLKTEVDALKLKIEEIMKLINK
ncbi:MAG: tail fiber domain-containing protein [Candidatus Delongbacteria bacterium]|nr:tail fiber domain-containing protein [Candidatus Delongbacteria bacterium]